MSNIRLVSSIFVHNFATLFFTATGSGEPNVASAKSSPGSCSERQPTETIQPMEGFSVINREDVALGEILGSGGFGAVHLASHKHWGDVAVKQFRSL